MNEKKLVPKRRFKKFLNTAVWEQRTIGEFGYFYYGKSAPKWSVTSDATTPCVRYGELYTKHKEKIDKIYSYTNIPVGNLKFSTGKEVLVPRVGEDPLDFANCSWLSIPGVAIGEMISVYNTKQNPLFTAYMFNALFKHEFAKRVEGGNVSNLYYAYLEDIPASYPNKEEQNKIVSFFESLSALITLHQRKLEKTKALKSAYLAEMFPAEGERVPKRRFAGFTGEWAEQKMGDIGSVAMNKRIFKEQTTEKGEVPFYKIGTFGSKPDAFISRELFEEYKAKYMYPDVGDILISASGSIGRTVEYIGNDEYFQDSNIVWLKHDGKLNNLFLKQFYNIVSWKGLEGSTIKRLYNKNILETQIHVPSLAEQKAIGEFFEKLDDTIKNQQQKLDKLKAMKQAYLQEMFV